MKSKEETYEFVKVNEKNLKAFNRLLKKIDKVVGENQYYIYSLYKFENPGTKILGGYVVKIVPKEYLEEYNKRKEDSLSPYTVMFSYNTYDLSFRKIKEEYTTFLLARSYENDFKKEIKQVFPSYQANISYNCLDNDGTSRIISSRDTWSSALKKYRFSNSYMNHINIFVPYGTDITKVTNELQDKGLLKKYYIKELRVLVLKENVNIESIDEYATKFSDKVYKTSGFDINGNGKIK